MTSSARRRTATRRIAVRPARTRLVTALAATLAVLSTAACAASPDTGVGSPGAGEPSAGVPVTFAAPGAAGLRGLLFGRGRTAVVLSNMSDNDPAAWERYAPTLAAEGYSVLAYTYRYPSPSRSLTGRMARDATADLRGAVAFVRTRGADRVVLVGASLGGMVAAKLAADLRADALVVLAAPAERVELGLRVESADLAAVTAPKLFLASKDDPNVDRAETRRLYDMSPEPRRWHVLPGTAHGTQVFGTPAAAELTRVLTEFITTAAPPTPGD